ncbi:MAG: 30S ribosomal protein S6 [Candidatus Binatia bacterium]
MTSQYEITYLITPQLTEEAREELMGRIGTHIEELGGKITHTSPALRRRLGYSIKNTNSAFIRTLHFELDSQQIMKLNRLLSKEEGVIRFTTLATPYREDVGDNLEELQRLVRQRRETKDEKRPKKEVSMEEVEKGIEEALTEEIK